MSWNDKIILLTGGTGSFGQQFVKTVLQDYNPKIIRIFSRDEFKQSQMQEQFAHDKRLRFFVGDVRDVERLNLAMRDADIVVHAAALKQVPMCEYNPFEAIKTNILGSQNIIQCAIHQSVSKVIAISSDKAVSPMNLYGATKLCSEKLFIQGNNYVGDPRKTLFSCCRYGNVLGSRGSVIETFRKQRSEGSLTITDKRMTRFWLTLEQGVKFVISCIERMEGGEVFIPKIPSMSVLDMAKTIAPDLPIKEIGIRPGEKIHEELINTDESRYTLEFPDCYIVYSLTISNKNKYFIEGKQLAEDFSYKSDTNKQWLSPDQLKTLLSSSKIQT